MITTLTTDVLVAGTAGGVGTTTVTALLFDALRQDSAGAPRLLDHSAGELGLRLSEGDDVPAVTRVDDPRALLILATAATPLGCVAVDRVLEQVVQRHGGSLLPQDRSLAAGGRIPTIRLTTHTERAQRQLTGILRERLRSL